jgi:hypothetical protein
MRRIAVIGILVTALAGPAAARQLDIPPRLQWDDNNGYCGEVSVQQAALYYGTYASQYRIREIYDPSQQRDLWVETSGPVLDALRLTRDCWAYDNESAPQFRGFMAWVKQRIDEGHPVIMAVYVAGGGWGEEYDHIVTATGIASDDVSAFLPLDELAFNDGYAEDPVVRPVWTLPASRLMLRGLLHEYCVPWRRDYGCAVTGIRDDAGETLPVSIRLDRWDEPDIAAGESSVILQAHITAASLQAGRTYVLLRYDSAASVPASSFLSSAFSAHHAFTASGPTYTYSDTFPSDSVVSYRCVPAGN